MIASAVALILIPHLPPQDLIAYSWDSEVFVIEPDGKNRRKLTTNQSGMIDPSTLSWSSDGRTLLFGYYAAGLDWKLWTVGLEDGASAKQLTAGPTGTLLGRWRPNAPEVAYVKKGEGLFLQALASTNPKQLTNRCATFDCLPSWSPKGTHLVYENRAEGKIYTYELARSFERPLTTGSHPEWSPTGASIAFIRAPERGSFQENSSVCLIDSDGEFAQRLCAGELAVWSPDGGSLAVILRTNFGNELHVVAWTGVRNITVAKGVAGTRPSWSPDSARIAFAKGKELWVVNSDGEGARKIALCGSAIGTGVSWRPRPK